LLPLFRVDQLDGKVVLCCGGTSPTHSALKAAEQSIQHSALSNRTIAHEGNLDIERLVAFADG
jgi:hypothetical protein